jgi:hypothetical protein
LQWILILCVPCVALIIAGRQVYLSRWYGLSTWKGGGMGMFAAADELPNRYAKVFLISADADRNPLVQLTPADADVLNRALEYPTRENFLRAAREIAHENWIPAFQPRPVVNVNGNGEPISATDKLFRQMVPSQLRPENEQKKSSMEIQFWKLNYDPNTRHVRAVLAETFVFSPEELFGPRRRQPDR